MFPEAIPLRCPDPVRWRSELQGRFPGDRSFMELGEARVRMVFRWCPPSSPGSPSFRESESGEMESVEVPVGFWIAQHPVNQAQWKAAMHQNPSRFKISDAHPVDSVSWDDATAFCKKVGLRLPTKREWEHACRAGSKTPYAIGDGEGLNSQLANFDGNYPGRTGSAAFEWWYRETTVHEGALPPNAWGLYEMHGQLWEWCEDWKGSDELGRALRGGSWFDVGRNAAAGSRFGDHPGFRINHIGFRPCPSSKQEAEPEARAAERARSAARDEQADAPAKRRTEDGGIRGWIGRLVGRRGKEDAR